MTEDYGRKVSKALAVVRRLHTDTAKLFRDCDQTIGQGKISVFGGGVTQDLSWSVNAKFWMAAGVFRYYKAEAPSLLGLLDGLAVGFFDAEEWLQEPFLFVGQLQYHVDPTTEQPAECKGWDLWFSYSDWWQDPQPNVLHSQVNPDPDGRIRWVKVIAVPLYSIDSLPQVEELMARVRGAPVPEA